MWGVVLVSTVGFDLPRFPGKGTGAAGSLDRWVSAKHWNLTAPF
jgi:hypothetical protein